METFEDAVVRMVEELSASPRPIVRVQSTRMTTGGWAVSIAAWAGGRLVGTAGSTGRTLQEAQNAARARLRDHIDQILAEESEERCRKLKASIQMVRAGKGMVS